MPLVKTVRQVGLFHFPVVASLLLASPALWNSANADELPFQKIVAHDGQPSDFFALSVAANGNRVVAGAIWEDTNGSNSGAAYVFEKQRSRWVQTQKLIAPDGAPNDVFGRSVAIDGDTIVVGANGMDDRGFDSGGAYVFEHNGASWAFRTKLLATDGSANDRAGWRVELDDGTAIVSAHREDSNGLDAGAAYIFVRSETGTWNQQAKLLPADGQADDLFGHDVAVCGDTAIVGAYKDDDDGDSSGSAYFFTRDSGGRWTQQQKITASDANVGYHFGRFVDIDKGVAIIGSPFWHPLNYGAAYIFELEGGVWIQQTRLVSNVLTVQENFASDVAIENGTAVTGSLFIQSNDPGKAYIYQSIDQVWSLRTPLLAADGAIADGFGRSIALAGETVIVGADADDDRGVNSGSAYIFDLTPVLGDLNCDGRVDLLDVAGFVEALLQNQANPLADMNQDGVVNLLDVEPFVSQLAGS